MIHKIAPGRYVVAVSGGVDSMVLLDLLAENPELKLTVAHFDHGIRAESRRDRLFVQQRARQYGLPFVYDEGRLGTGASEEAARQARYGFLHAVRGRTGAQAVVTAHHKDDVLETAVINLLRGTGRRGLSSLRTTDVILRPLLGTVKADIRRYAAEHDLQWQEDMTNQDTVYLRNHVRHRLVPRIGAEEQGRLLGVITRQHELNHEIDQLLESFLDMYDANGRLDRRAFVQLPHAVAREVMAAWLRRHNIRDFDGKTIERLVHAAKIRESGKRTDVRRDMWMEIRADSLALTSPER